MIMKPRTRNILIAGGVGLVGYLWWRGRQAAPAIAPAMMDTQPTTNYVPAATPTPPAASLPPDPNPVIIGTPQTIVYPVTTRPSFSLATALRSAFTSSVTPPAGSSGGAGAGSGAPSGPPIRRF